jgi:pimeloyl-ACP methyl ester carboxylesterase
METQVQTWTIGEFHFTVNTAGPASGPSVLLLHGFPQTRHMWRHQLPALAAARCVRNHLAEPSAISRLGLDLAVRVITQRGIAIEV